jgi:hypothetical protein
LIRAELKGIVEDMGCDAAEGFYSPEEAALSGWEPVSKARVVEARVESSDSVYVVVDTEPSHPMRVHCERINGRWLWTSDVTA